MKYRYAGFQSSGKQVRGEIDVAGGETEARSTLKSKGIWVKQLVAVAGAAPMATAGSAAPAPGSAAKKPRSRNTKAVPVSFFESLPSLTEFTAFIRQLSTMIGAGIPIVQSLGILSEQMDNKALARALGDMKIRIESGMSLTEATAIHPKIFDRVFLNLIAAGEASGTIDKVLLRLATHYEKSAAIARKVKSAMTYPTVMLVIITCVVILLLYIVVPKFAEMFASGGKQLPEATQMVMTLSQFVQDNILFIMGGIVAAGFGLRYIFTNEQTRKQIDPVLLKLPFLGKLIMKVSIARFSRTLSTMIEAGVPIIEALNITSKVSGNYAIESAVVKTREAITSGKTLAEPLMAAKVFPKMAVSMIAVGEQTGALAQMLVKIAEFYEDEVDGIIGGLSSIIEPLMMVFVGIIAAGILIPMYLPVFKMGEAFGGG